MSGSGPGRDHPEPGGAAPAGGAGGGGSAGGGGGSGDCSTLMMHTPLNSPKPAVVSRLSKGDILDVVLVTQGSATVVQATHNGQAAGSITFAGVTRLVNCLQRGYRFVAEVVRVSGGACDVLVRPESGK